MPSIFISYRRDDSAFIAETIHASLANSVGVGEVFLDSKSIPAGKDFKEHIKSTMVNCKVLVVIVGEKWLRTSANAPENKVITNEDFVFFEIEECIRRQITILPVLAGVAKMPVASELPPQLQQFCYLNALEVRSGRFLQEYLDALHSDIAKVPGLSPYLRTQLGQRKTARPAYRNALLLYFPRRPAAFLFHMLFYILMTLATLFIIRDLVLGGITEDMYYGLIGGLVIFVGPATLIWYLARRLE